MNKTTKCWCLSCDPKQGEIGLECKLSPIEKFMEQQFADPDIKAVYDRLSKR